MNEASRGDHAGWGGTSIHLRIMRNCIFYAFMWPALLLVLYSLVIVAASLAGGWLPTYVRLTHTRTQLMMSLVAGLMLGVALFHLVPHAVADFASANAVDRTMWWAMLGLLFMFFLLRAFHFHQHDHGVPPEAHDHEHEHEHDHDHDHHAHVHHHDHAGDRHHGRQAHQLSWVGVAVGLAIHTAIDGVALGASVQAEALHQHGMGGLYGLGVFLAIVLHKPLDALSITTLMSAGGWTPQARNLVNGTFALMCPLGAALFYFSVETMGAGQQTVVATALAFSAGVFLCIALGDLLPELHFHDHDRAKLSAALLTGVVLAYLIGFLEPAHTHRPPPAERQEARTEPVAGGTPDGRMGAASGNELIRATNQFAKETPPSRHSVRS